MKHVMPPIAVKAPCPKRWAEMRGGTTTRFCDHCELHVHNLSAMTRSNLGAVTRLSQTGRICVTYMLRPDGTMVTRWDDILETVALSCRRAATWLFAAISSIALGTVILALLLLSLGPPLPYYRIVRLFFDCSHTVATQSAFESSILRFFGLVSAFVVVAFVFVTLSV